MGRLAERTQESEILSPLGTSVSLQIQMHISCSSLIRVMQEGASGQVRLAWRGALGRWRAWRAAQERHSGDSAWEQTGGWCATQLLPRRDVMPTASDRVPAVLPSKWVIFDPV